MVLADDGVPDRLARPGHAHGERQQRQARPCRRGSSASRPGSSGRGWRPGRHPVCRCRPPGGRAAWRRRRPRPAEPARRGRGASGSGSGSPTTRCQPSAANQRPELGGRVAQVEVVVVDGAAARLPPYRRRTSRGCARAGGRRRDGRDRWCRTPPAPRRRGPGARDPRRGARRRGRPWRPAGASGAPGESRLATESSTSSMIGTGQRVPSARRMDSQTASWSARPRKPRRGEKPPVTRSSRSSDWRRLSVQDGQLVARRAQLARTVPGRPRGRPASRRAAGPARRARRRSPPPRQRPSSPTSCRARSPASPIATMGPQKVLHRGGERPDAGSGDRRSPDPDVGQARSKRSRFMTLSHAATKSRTNFSFASSEA